MDGQEPWTCMWRERSRPPTDGRRKKQMVNEDDGGKKSEIQRVLGPQCYGGLVQVHLMRMRVIKCPSTRKI